MQEKEIQIQAAPVIGPEQAAEAERILHKYKAGKAALDRRLIDNELWFRMAHWKQYKNRMMEGKPQPSSGWLFNSIASKHAEAMDNYPEPNVLPRAADDEATARTLSSILPVVLEQADYEQSTVVHFSPSGRDIGYAPGKHVQAHEGASAKHCMKSTPVLQFLLMNHYCTL